MSKDKKKVFIWSDSPTVPTGFGIVAKNLFRDLHKNYDVEILGINEGGTRRFDHEKYFIYPAKDSRDQLGYRKLPNILRESKPDIVILFQDLLHINRVWQKVNEVSPDSKKIIYFPIGGTPVNATWRQPLVEADVVITYTDFAKNAIENRFSFIKGMKDIKTLDHGVDTDTFFPIRDKEKLDSVKSVFPYDDKFNVLNLNRFSPRKAIPLTLRAFALFAKGYKKCECGNWYLKSEERCDLNGCGPDKVVEEVDGRSDSYLYLHMRPDEVIMGRGRENSLPLHCLANGFTNEDLKGDNPILSLNSRDLYENPIPQSEINKVYNKACVSLTTTLGEGFGLLGIESSATGTPVIAPNNSAHPEVLGDYGHLIENVAHINLPHDNAHMRPVVDVRKVVEALEIEYQEWLKNDKKPVFNKDMVERVKKDFNWDDKRDYFESLI